MQITSWLKKWQSLKNTNKPHKSYRNSGVPGVSEALESRTLPAVSVLLVGGELNIDSDADDTIRVSASGGNVLIEAGPAGGVIQPVLNLGTVSASSIQSLVITGGDQENNIDLSGVRAADFTSLTNINVQAGNGDDLLTGSPDFGDVLNGENGRDTILGQGGNDTLDGGDGADSIDSGAGDDSVLAGDGTDSVVTGDGNDTVDAGNGSDTVSLGDGNDSIFAGNGEDSINGGAGNDTLNGDGGTDSINGGDGDDLILGGEFNDTLNGGTGADILNGQGGNDLVFAGPSTTNTTFTSATVLSTNFDSGVQPELSGTTTLVAVQGYAGFGTGANVFSGSFLQNATGALGTPQTPTTLTLTNLPAHTSVDLNFLLAIINSWNGLSSSLFPNEFPDFFNVRVDGTLLFNGSFDNVGASQGYVAPPGVLLTPRPFTDLGFPTPTAAPADSAWNLGLDPVFNNIPHTASTLTIEFFADGAGFQGGTNESWGIDNLEVILNGVPVVTTIPSNDTLAGGIGNDTLNGGDGNDLLNGQSGNDAVLGGDGNDSLLGGGGNDQLLGEAGTDTILGQAGDDTLEGGGEADILRGGDGNDVVLSGALLLAINDVAVAEGNSGTTNLVFTVSLSAPSATTVTVNFATASGTAIASQDFSSASGVLTFAPGTFSQTITIAVAGDSVIEPDETFSVNLTNAVGAQFFDATGQGSILNDDSTVSVQTLYAANSDPTVNQQSLHVIDPTTGASTLVGPTFPPNRGLNGLTSDNMGTLYGGSSPFPAGVYTVNRTTGAATQIITVTGGGIDEGDIAFNTATNQFFGIDFDDSELLQIDLVTGTTTNLGKVIVNGMPSPDDLDWDGLAYRGSTLYGYVGNRDQGTGLRNTLYTVDTTTRVVTVVGPLGIGAGQAGGMAYDPTLDVFYLMSRASSTLFRVNPLTGAATPVGDTGLGVVLGLSIVVDPAVPVIPVVPPPTVPVFPASSNDTLQGDAGNDTLIGSAGNDVLNGGGDNDNISGGAGNDSITGGSGLDTLNGNVGDDTLNGQGGADSLDGGEGNDTHVWDGASSSNDTLGDLVGDNTLLVQGTVGVNTFSIGQNADFLATVTESGKTVTVGPTFGTITLNAGDGNDVVTIGNIANVPAIVLAVHGENGDDILTAAGSSIGRVRLLLDGGEGNDTLTGGNDGETLTGANGNDSLMGGAGQDTLSGGLGNDIVDGGDGNDSLSGNEGNDSLIGNNGNDIADGNDGDDTLNGGAGNDTLLGSVGDDSLLGTAGDDSLLGSVGTDTLGGGDGADTLDGGRNDDLLVGGLGNDKLRGDHGNDVLDAGDGDDFANGGDGNDSILGGNGNDGLNGADGNDTINAAAGNDTALGGDGADILLGGGGNDVLLGEDGADTVNGQSGADTVAGNQGVDSILDAAAEINEAFSLPTSIRTLLEAV